MKDIKTGSVIQINEHNPELELWCGCTMIVDEVKDWGVLAGMKLPHQGIAYLRIKYGDFDYIGEAALIIE